VHAAQITHDVLDSLPAWLQETLLLSNEKRHWSVYREKTEMNKRGNNQIIAWKFSSTSITREGWSSPEYFTRLGIGSRKTPFATSRSDPSLPASRINQYCTLQETHLASHSPRRSAAAGRRGRTHTLTEGRLGWTILPAGECDYQKTLLMTSIAVPAKGTDSIFDCTPIVITKKANTTTWLCRIISIRIVL